MPFSPPLKRKYMSTGSTTTLPAGFYNGLYFLFFNGRVGCFCELDRYIGLHSLRFCCQIYNLNRIEKNSSQSNHALVQVPTIARDRIQTPSGLSNKGQLLGLL